MPSMGSDHAAWQHARGFPLSQWGVQARDVRSELEKVQLMQLAASGDRLVGRNHAETAGELGQAINPPTNGDF